MDNIDGNTYLDLLFQKVLRYEHHQENFKKIFSNGVTPFELCIKKTTAMETVNEDFHIKWHSILKNAEKQLIETKMQFIVVMWIKALFPNDEGKVKNILR